MINTQYINLNMTPSGVMPVLYCSQYDIGRPLGMVVYNGGEAVDLDTYTCTIEATRTDGTAITAAVITDNNIGVFTTTATMTNQEDKYLVKLVLFDSNSRRVASLAFVMCVTPKTMDENAESIEEDESLYQQYTGTVQTLIAEIREDIADLRNERFYATPEMFGAIGDGTTDDTAAFRALASVTGDVVIPKKTYVINSAVTLAGNVLHDDGTYPNYLPMYKKPLELRLIDLSYGDNILLPVEKSYAESITYIDGKYYVTCNDYTSNPHTHYIAVYDEDFTYKSKVYTSAAYGISNSSCTDGTYLYIDFDNRYHVKYDPSNLSTPVLAVQNSSYRNVEYYNKQLYGVQIAADGTVSVSKLAANLNTLTGTWSVSTSVTTPQSCTIFNGQVYLPTTFGMFRVIDMVSHELLEVRYQFAKEVECFYEHNGKLMVMGHLYGYDGLFNVGALDGGIDADIMTYVPLDGAHGNINVTRIGRNNFYQVTNGLAQGYPADKCDLLILNNVMLCLSQEQNSVWVYQAHRWVFVQSFVRASRELYNGSGFLYLYQSPGTQLCIRAINFHATAYETTISVDLSDAWSQFGLDDNYTAQFMAFGRTYGVSAQSQQAMYIGHFIVTKTSITVYIRNLDAPSSDNSLSTINASFNFLENLL